MAYIPPMKGYKPFYIQTSADSTAKDTAVQWGLVAKTNPYPAIPSPKDVYKNDWLDEDGEEEYTASIQYQPIEFSVSFYVKCFDATNKTAVEVLRAQMDVFFKHIMDGEFSVYDSYTGIGRQKVRYAGFKEDSFRQADDWARCIFTVNFKANDPISRVALVNNHLVIVSQ